MLLCGGIAEAKTDVGGRLAVNGAIWSSDGAGGQITAGVVVAPRYHLRVGVEGFAAFLQTWDRQPAGLGGGRFFVGGWVRPSRNVQVESDFFVGGAVSTPGEPVLGVRRGGPRALFGGRIALLGPPGDVVVGGFLAVGHAVGFRYDVLGPWPLLEIGLMFRWGSDQRPRSSRR